MILPSGEADDSIRAAGPMLPSDEADNSIRAAGPVADAEVSAGDVGLKVPALPLILWPRKCHCRSILWHHFWLEGERKVFGQ